MESKIQSVDLTEYMKSLGIQRRVFRPYVYVDPENNFIEIFFKDASYYAEWISPRLSVFKSNAEEELVGFEIHGALKKEDLEKLDKISTADLEKFSQIALTPAPWEL